MPSYLDLGLIVIVLISAFLAMLRGFTREVLAIASWAAAAVTAFYLYPLVLPYVKPYVAKDTVAIAVSGAGVFLATLIIVSLITLRISDVILDSKVGALDRSLGFVFGTARGVLLCVIAFAFFDWLVPSQTQPEWVKTARMRPFLLASEEHLLTLLPEDPEQLLSKLKKPIGAGLGEEPPADFDADPKAPPSKLEPAGDGKRF
jgi:membrane protein required for colicin V production